jgi:hypothetical protein
MTSPVIYAAAYLLITGQVAGQPPIHGLDGDAIPSHLLGLGRDCQLPPAPTRGPQGNHLTIRMRRPPGPPGMEDDPRPDRHRHHHHHRHHRR